MLEFGGADTRLEPAENVTAPVEEASGSAYALRERGALAGARAEMEATAEPIRLSSAASSADTLKSSSEADDKIALEAGVAAVRGVMNLSPASPSVVPVAME